jgi:hypothetical protein
LEQDLRLKAREVPKNKCGSLVPNVTCSFRLACHVEPVGLGETPQVAVRADVPKTTLDAFGDPDPAAHLPMGQVAHG